MTERWRDIPGYEGRYQASTEGRVRSLDRTVLDSRGWDRRLKGRILKQQLNSVSGYPCVMLSVDCERRNTVVHRLVAQTFLRMSEKPQVNHKDGNKQNARVKNLEWRTHRENSIHAANVLGVLGVHRRRPVVAIAPDGAKKHFCSHAEAERSFGGQVTGAVGNAIRLGYKAFGQAWAHA